MVAVNQKLTVGASLYSYELKTSSKKWPVRKGLVLQWNDGWGEISPLPGFSPETLEEARDEIVSLLPNLAAACPKLPSVRFGLAAAKLPFSRTSLKVPLCLLNDPREGFSILKLKLGHLEIDQAEELVRKYIGAYRLRLDCSRAWSLEQALSFASRFSPDNFEYLEEPVRTVDELIRFSAMTGFPIAADESVRNFPDQSKLKAAVVKPTVVGELPVFTVPTVLSSAYESSLGLLQIARLADKNSPAVGLDTFRFFQKDLLVPPLKAEKGFLTWDANNESPIDMSKLCLIASAP